MAFILCLGLAGAAFYFWLSSGEAATRRLVIETDQSVGGVSPDSPVKFKGLKVGHIVSVGFDPRDANKVRIVFVVRDSVPLTQSSYGQLATQGITGLSTLALSTPDPKAPPLTGQPARLPLRPGLLDKIKSQGTADLARISRILDHLDQLTDSENLGHIDKTLAGLSAVTSQLAADEKNLRPALAQLPALTRQLSSTARQIETLSRQAIPAIDNAGQAAKSAQGLGRSGRAVMRQLNDQVLPHIESLTAQMNRTARQIQDLGAELQAKPDSVLTGPPKRRPGPGEPGFKPPAPSDASGP